MPVITINHKGASTTEGTTIWIGCISSGLNSNYGSVANKVSSDADASCKSLTYASDSSKNKIINMRCLEIRSGAAVWCQWSFYTTNPSQISNSYDDVWYRFGPFCPPSCSSALILSVQASCMCDDLGGGRSCCVNWTKDNSADNYIYVGVDTASSSPRLTGFSVTVTALGTAK